MKKLFFIIFFISVLSIRNLAQQTENKTKDSTGFIQANGGKIYYESAGTGDNIVLIHDGIVHHEIWDAQFHVFAKNYRVVRYDRRGYGKTPVSTAKYSNVEDLNEIFRQLKIDKAIVFGMSAGGGLAMDFTVKYPEKVTALVLVGAVVTGYGYSMHMMTRGGRLNPKDLSDSKKFIQYFCVTDPYAVASENKIAKERFLKLVEANPQNVNSDKYFNLKSVDKPAALYLHEIKIPTLILVGDQDIPDVHAHSGVIEFGIKGSKRIIINKAGHLIPMEQPEIFNETVTDFLNTNKFNIILNSKGIDAAVQYFHSKQKQEPNLKLFTENEMNTLGYKYLQAGKAKEAIELFKLNTIAYPNSANAYDSLGEAYMVAGNNNLAIKNYEKSLELDPNNINAVEQLKKLKSK